MPIPDEETPRLAEINRRIGDLGQTLSDFRSEVRSNFSEMMRKDTYIAERDAMRDRIANLEARARTMQTTVYTAIVGAVISIITVFVTRGGT